MDKTTVFVCALVIALMAACAWLGYKNASMRHAMQEAAYKLRSQAIEKQISNEILLEHQGAENAIRESRKVRERQLKEGSCLTGDEYIDYLLRLLDEDAKDRCELVPSGNPAR